MRFFLGTRLAVALVLGGLAALVLREPSFDLAFSHPVSTQIQDRNGLLLRAYQTESGHWRFPLRAEEVDPLFLAMLMAYEDRRFLDHQGVDMFALLRAAGQWISHGRIVSGGSTLSMQAARLMEERGEARGLLRKWREMRLARALERRLGKEGVLALYLSRAPYGGNVEGLRAASLSYFGREPRRLTPGEAALLVALPQSPETRRPDRFAERARAARSRVLARMGEAGLLNAEQIAAAEAEPIPTQRRAMPQFAFHLADHLRTEQPVLRTTLDRALQVKLEHLLRERVTTMGANLSGALVVVDYRSGEILARLGAADPADATRAGAVDMAQALRSPGSTLKPFIYAMAFESGLAHPETLIDDRPTRFGTYAPNNFDLTFQGTVSVRQALQMSLNIPVIALLDVVGPRRLQSRLEASGARPVLPRGEVAGLAIGLGGLGMSLMDLMQAYAALARGGEAIALEAVAGRQVPLGRLVDPHASWQVADILLAAPPPESAVSGRLAFKTGTSYGYRDGWALGFDGRHLIGVWVGRPDGSSVPGLSGRGMAAPILFDAFARIGPVVPPQPAPAGVYVTTNARLPAPLRHFGRYGGEDLRESEAETLAITFPADGVRLDLGGDDMPLAIKTTGGEAPFTVLLNGAPVAQVDRRRRAEIASPGTGFHQLSVIDARGQAANVRFRVE